MYNPKEKGDGPSDEPGAVKKEAKKLSNPVDEDESSYVSETELCTDPNCGWYGKLCMAHTYGSGGPDDVPEFRQAGSSDDGPPECPEEFGETDASELAEQCDEQVDLSELAE